MPPRRIDPRSVAPETALAALLASPRARGAEVTIEHDGTLRTARAGEPLALSLMAAGAVALSRSIKFHRPRGVMCLRGACDGCLVRLDGVPNVMACRAPARSGASVTSQNAFPNAGSDLLRMTDWFFPKQFDHHHLMVRFGPALNRAMQVFARRMAGMGTLPDDLGPLPDPERIACDVLVVGAGPAGLAASAAIARTGARVLCVDEEPHAGGTLRDEPARLSGGLLGAEAADALTDAAMRAGATVRCNASATATFDNATLVVTSDRILAVHPRVRVFANGGHEGLGVFESNDLPGIFTARAAARALAYGVLPGERVVVCGDAWPADGLMTALRAAGATVTHVPDASRLAGARGTHAVTAAVVVDTGTTKRRSIACDALILALDATAAYELAGQAGAVIRPDAARRCFVADATDAGATARADVFVTGLLRSAAESIGPIDRADPLASTRGPLADGRRVGQAVVTALAREEVP